MKLIPLIFSLISILVFTSCGTENSAEGKRKAGYYQPQDDTGEEDKLANDKEPDPPSGDEVISAVHEGPDKATGVYDEARPRKNWRLPYNLERPTAKFKLPNKLNEISGLGVTSGGTRLLAVNDEKGTIYFIDKEEGKIIEEIDFARKGDYEGVEMVGDDLFVVKSNGDVYSVENLGTTDERTETFKTALNSDNDVEGLAYDRKLHRLLLACKRYPGHGYEGQRAIYAFNIMSEKLDPEPAYLIHDKDLENYFKMEGVDQKLLQIFTPDAAAKDFQPSGIAIHPISGDLYILSSVGKILMVMTQDGDIRHLEKLDKGLFPQPEGICFEKNGTLYISTEGKGRRGRIFRFPMK